MPYCGFRVAIAVVVVVLAVVVRWWVLRFETWESRPLLGSSLKVLWNCGFGFSD